MSKRRWRPLAALIAVVILGALGLALGGYAYYQRETQAIQAQNSRELRTISALKIDQIVAWRSERLKDARVFADMSGLSQRLTRWQSGDQGQREEIQQELIRSLDVLDDQDILLASPTGELLVSAKAEMTHLAPESLRGIEQAVREGRAVLTELYFCRPCGEVHLEAIAPLPGPKGSPVAVLLLKSNPEARLFPLLQSWPVPSETAETLLVRRDGEDVLFLNRLRHRPHAPLTQRYPLTRLDLPASQAVQGRTGTFLGKDYRNVEVLTDLQPVPDSPWFLVAKVDAREILAETRYRGRVIMAFTALGILLLATGLGALFFFGQARLYRDLIQAAREKRPRSLGPWVRGARALALGAGLVSLLVGSLVLLGWALDLTVLKGVLPRFVTMKVNTAVGFQLAGVALALRAWFPGHRTLSWVSRVAASALILLAAVTVLQDLTGADFHIDQVLFREPPGSIGTLAPGRMASVTALGFMLLGAGLLLAHQRTLVVLSQGLALAAAGPGLISLLGHFYGQTETTGLNHHFQMALTTAGTLLVVSVGLLACHPKEGLLRTLSSATLGGWLLRRTLPFLVTVPIVLEGLGFLGETLNLYEHAMSMTLFASLTIGFLLLGTDWVARALDRLDEARQVAKAQARERLEQLQAILHSLAEGVIATDMDGRVLHVNPEAERLTGWREAEAFGLQLEAVARLIDEGTRQPVASPMDRIRQEPIAQTLPRPTLLLDRDGSERPMAVRITPVRDTAGALAQAVMVLRDLTADRAAQRALLASAAKYHSLHESQWDAFAQVDMDGRFMDCNRLYEEMLGYTSEELASLTYEDLTPSHWHEMEARIVKEEILPRGVSQVYEKEYRHKNGTVFPVELRTFLVRGEDGTPSGMRALVRDITERRRVEAALQASEEKFRNIFEQASIGISISTPGGHLQANDAFCRMLGYTEEELNARNWVEISHPGDVERTQSIVQSLLEGDASHARFEKRHLCKDGHIIDTEVSMTLQRDALGGPQYFLTAVVDITERKRAEARQARFTRILESSLNEVYVFDARSLHFEYVNGSALRNLGYSLEDLKAMTPVDLKPEFTEATFRQTLAPLLTHELKRYDFATVHRRADGSLYPVDVQLQLVEQQGTPVFLAVIQDITARRAAEALIQGNTELLNLTGTLAKVGGWEFNARTLQGTWTDEVARIHDLDPAQPTNAELGLSFYSAASRPIIAQAVQEAIQLGRPYDLEVELISAKGVKKNVRTIGNPVLDPDGTVVQVRGILMDITDRKAAEEKLRAAQAETQHLLQVADQSRLALLSLVEDLSASDNEVRRLNLDLEHRVETRTTELAEANRELEAFAYSVSHDLRAPLRHMDGFLAMLTRHLGDRLDDKGAHYLQVAQKAALRMSQLVDGLLSFSRLGRTDVHRVKVDATSLAKSVIEEFKTEYAERDVQWVVGSLPVLLGDPTLLRLVFQNLVGNALKFTRGRPETRIELLPMEEMDGEVGVLIRDNGVGFDPTYDHKLFGVFQRLHREEEFEGTGIGLANAHRIITRHGGRIWAEGRPGEGATFQFTLPKGEGTP